MKITVNGATIEDNNKNVAINAAIATFSKATSNEILPPDLEEVRGWALEYLNQWRGEQRLAIGLTSAEFQQLCYTGKALEARRWLAEPETYFGLAKEAAARGITNEAMAGIVSAQWAAWQAGSDTIEAVYVTAKAATEAAVSVKEIAAALEGLE
jgi:hypothetical protein